MLRTQKSVQISTMYGWRKESVDTFIAPQKGDWHLTVFSNVLKFPLWLERWSGGGGGGGGAQLKKKLSLKQTHLQALLYGHSALMLSRVHACCLYLAKVMKDVRLTYWLIYCWNMHLTLKHVQRVFKLGSVKKIYWNLGMTFLLQDCRNICSRGLGAVFNYYAVIVSCYENLAEKVHRYSCLQCCTGPL